MPAHASPWSRTAAARGDHAQAAFAFGAAPALFAGLAAIPFVRAGFTAGPAAVWSAALPFAAILPAAMILARRPDTRGIGLFFTGLAQMMAVSLGGVLMAYAAATSNRPLVDGALFRIDQALGYRFQDYAAFIANHRALGALLTLGYESIFFQPIAILIGCLGTGRTGRWNRYLLATMISLTLTALIFTWCPATTAWTFLHMPEGQIAALNLPTSGDGWLHDLLTIRAGRGRAFLPDSCSGLIAFPSYHCCAAVLYLWAMWPMKAIRPVAIPINLLMIASTPINGGHYMADLLGGGLVALAGIAISRGLDPGVPTAAPSPGPVRPLS